MKSKNVFTPTFLIVWVLLTMTALSATNLQAAIIKCLGGGRGGNPIQIKIETPCKIPTPYGPKSSISNDNNKSITKVLVYVHKEENIEYQSDAKCSEIKKVTPSREAGSDPEHVGAILHRVDFETDDYSFTYTYREPISHTANTWLDIYKKDPNADTYLNSVTFNTCIINLK